MGPGKNKGRFLAETAFECRLSATKEGEGGGNVKETIEKEGSRVFFTLL